MSNSVPPDPPPLKLEGIAVFVAFTTINSLLYYWALNKQHGQFSLKTLRDSPPSPQPKSASEELPAPKPTSNAPESLSLPLTASVTANAHVPELSSPSTPSSLSPKWSKPQAKPQNTSVASAPNTTRSAPIATAPTPTPIVEFSDVPDNSWASRSIKSLKNRNIAVGYLDGSFRPNQFATRAEFAVMLQKIFDSKNRLKAVEFKDLPVDYWASDAIKNVCKTGILQGYPANDFRPDQPVTRAEVLVALATVLKLKTPSTPAKTLQVYKDSDQVLDYAIAKVAAAQEAGLIAGYSKENLLVPNKPATRAELAAMLDQALAISGKEQQVSTRF
ncbi:MAG: S-layer homology domain-containing protein [Cyanobacteriota bacterium]